MTARAKTRAVIKNYSRDKRGAVAPIFAIYLLCLVALTGTVIDVGRVLWVQRQLQSSADAAALAGANYVVTNPTTATSTAIAYSGLSGEKNAVLGAGSVTMVGGAPTLKCFTSITTPACSGGAGSYNGIIVTQQAVVPMSFLRVVGINAMKPTATSVASARGGGGKALDIMVVLDTTASMSQSDPLCSTPGASKIQCALAGAYALVGGLNPALDKVGFMVFPGLTPAGVTSDTTCGGKLTSSQIASYKNIGTSGATYTAVGLTNGYSSGGKLTNTNSAVIAAGGGGGGCAGIQAVGGVGTFFADAISAAQSALSTDGNANSQKVIVLLSDGDSNATSSNLPTGKAANQCQQAIASAKSAVAASTWVYSVAYDAATSGGCSTDTSNYTGVNLKGISPCTTMQDIASDSTKFYSDGSGKSGCIGTGGNNTDLVTLFKSISSDLTVPRLLPNNTT